MFTQEQRAEAFRNYRIETIDGKLYAVVTVDFGRTNGEVHLQDMYQRLQTDTDALRKLWHGTPLAADALFERRQKRLQEVRELQVPAGIRHS